jgi:hypothetical protein
VGFDDEVMTPERSLAEVASEFAAGRATPQGLHDAFVSATVFCEAGDRPGFVAVGPPGDGFIPVFTSDRELARARGAVRWFSTTGADLLGLVPDGYDLILDIAGPTPLRLCPAAVHGTAAAEAGRRFAAVYRDTDESALLFWKLGGDRYKAYIDQPIPSPIDEDPQAAVEAYIRADPADRAALLKHSTRDADETLECFAERLAVAAVRFESMSALRLGLVALGMVIGRVDYPDVNFGMSKLDHSAQMLGVALADLVDDVAEFLPEPARTFIDGWLTRDDRGPTLIRHMGYAAQGTGPDFRYVLKSPYEDPPDD